MRSILVIILSFFQFAPKSYAQDAYGLDEFKSTVQEATESKSEFKTKFGNHLKLYSIPGSQDKLKMKPSNETLRFLIQGGLHGNEMLTSEFVAWLAGRISRGQSKLNLLNAGNVEFDLIPFANPDGTILYTRYNSNHINLNRNFEVLWGMTKENPGTKPFSEIESQAIKNLMVKRNYTGAVDIHGYVNWIVAPSPPSDKFPNIKLRQSREQLYRKWYSVLERESKILLPGYELKTAGQLGDGGSFEDYAWWGQEIPAFCLELFSDKQFVINSIASEIFNFLLPKKGLSGLNLDSSRTDTFLTYETFIFKMFQEAGSLKIDKKIQNEIAKGY